MKKVWNMQHLLLSHISDDNHQIKKKTSFFLWSDDYVLETLVFEDYAFWRLFCGWISRVKEVCNMRLVLLLYISDDNHQTKKKKQVFSCDLMTYVLETMVSENYAFWRLICGWVSLYRRLHVAGLSYYYYINLNI